MKHFHWHLTWNRLNPGQLCSNFVLLWFSQHVIFVIYYSISIFIFVHLAAFFREEIDFHLLRPFFLRTSSFVKTNVEKKATIDFQNTQLIRGCKILLTKVENFETYFYCFLVWMWKWLCTVLFCPSTFEFELKQLWENSTISPINLWFCPIGLVHCLHRLDMSCDRVWVCHFTSNDIIEIDKPILAFVTILFNILLNNHFFIGFFFKWCWRLLVRYFIIFWN